jgi:phenylalanyl-tRNA synthetase beta chain
MKISYEWLKELIAVRESAEEIAKRFLLSGLEVESLTKTGIGRQNVIAVEILKIEKHPEADSLFVTNVDAGNFGKKQIITNLQNLKTGMKLLAGIEGVVFKSGIEIKKSKIKNVESEGMFARWEDLGLPYKGDIAVFLDETVANGTNYLEIGEFEDTIIEVELTANRGDCLGMFGIAREVSTYYKIKTNLLPSDHKTSSLKTKDLAKVEIMTKNCERYSAGIIRNVKVKPSPMWMQLRLVKSGIRPISNIVDITNYIMMEDNQPLHAFDMDMIKDGKVIVRNGKKDEILVSLDGVERKILQDDIIIADSDRGHCIGGIMGGEVSEVSDVTKNIFLESAFFNPKNIRRTSKRLGLKSESSYRFERTIDKENTGNSLKRALYLFEKLGIGEICNGIIDEYPAVRKKQIISTSAKWINDKIGSDIPENEITDILERLGFETVKSGNTMSITVPSWRSDVSIKEDIAEEVARIHGFNNITPTLFPSRNAAARTPVQQFERNLRELMYGLGCDEALNLSMIGDPFFDKMKLSPDHKYRKIVKIETPLSDEFQGMRNSLIPGMIRTVAFNVTRQNKGLSLFEIGCVSFLSGKELPIEETMLSVACAGIKDQKDHTGSETRYDYYDLKGYVDSIFGFTRSKPEFSVSKESFFHPYQQTVISSGGIEAGIMGKLHPDVAKSLDIDVDCFVAELNLRVLFENAKMDIEYSEIPKFPSSERDLALIVNENVASASILDEVRNSGVGILRDVRIFDIYKGQNIEKGKYSVAINMSFNKITSTLTDKEIDEATGKILNILKQKFDAKIR